MDFPVGSTAQIHFPVGSTTQIHFPMVVQPKYIFLWVDNPNTFSCIPRAQTCCVLLSVNIVYSNNFTPAQMTNEEFGTL